MINFILDLFEDRTFGATRSSTWSIFRKQHIKKECEFCGTKGTLLSPLELHHVLPFHEFPHLEEDPENVVTGCRNCHLKFYHLRSFKSYDKDIKKVIADMKEKIKNRP